MRAAIQPELIEKYMADHAMMLGLPDVPDSESDEWRDWVRVWHESMVRKGHTLPSAIKDALLRVTSDAPSRWREQLPAVLKALDEMRSENLAQGDDGTSPRQPTSREAAEAASRDCEHCAGGGLAAAYHRDHEGMEAVVDEDGKRRILRVTAPCVCPMGRWLWSAWKPEIRQRSSDLARVEREEVRDWSLVRPDLNLASRPASPPRVPRFRRPAEIFS